MTRQVLLRFAVSGGTELGLGHVLRCTLLAATARSRGISAEFALHGDAAARNVIAAELPDVPVRSFRDDGEIAEDCDGVILDTPCAIGNVLAATRGRGVSSIVLDRLDHLDEADWTVLPVAHASRVDHRGVRQGPSYCIAEPSARGMKAPAYPGGRDVVLITLGGADPHGVTERLSRCLSRVLADPSAAVFVVGPCFRERDEVAERIASHGWKVETGLSRTQLFALMMRARFAFAGFGVSVYELASLGVPMLYFAQREADLAAARRLEALGVGAVAGLAESFEESELADRLTQTLLRRDWCQRSSQRGLALAGDGGGPRRIIDLACRPPRLTGSQSR